MKEYRKLLFQLIRGEKYTKDYLVRKSSGVALEQAIEDGMICLIGKNDIEMPIYMLTEKGANFR